MSVASRMKHGLRRIYIGPVEVAGYNASLAKGLRRQGFGVRFTTFFDHTFEYGGEDRDFLAWAIKKANSRQGKRLKEGGFAYRWIYSLLSVIYLAWLCATRDVFIFSFGLSLLKENRDLGILRFLGKKVIFNIGFGSEARPPFINGSFVLRGEGFPSFRDTERISKEKCAMVRRIEKSGAIVIGAPFSTSQYADRPFINFFAIGMPIERTISSRPQEDVCRADSRVRILHSPSHPRAKGTREIRETIRLLKNEGYDLEYVEITDSPNQVVLKEIQKCDFIVDQLYSDTPLAVFAAEAAFYGKATVVGGYGLDELSKYVPNGMLPPSKTCHPTRLREALIELIEKPEIRMGIGESAKAFVLGNWSPVEVAKRYMRLVSCEIPGEWWLDPREVTYIHGGGLSDEILRRFLRGLIDAQGMTSLHLSHRPDLEEAILDFIDEQ